MVSRYRLVTTVLKCKISPCYLKLCVVMIFLCETNIKTADLSVNSVMFTKITIVSENVVQYIYHVITELGDLFCSNI